MGLLILLAIGGSLGWISAIMLDETNRECVYTQIGAGAFGSAFLGSIMSAGLPFNSIAPETLVYGALGGIKGVVVVIVLGRMLAKRTTQSD
ncbi:MAG: hypothetical protein WA908_12140 [Pontixanthobacter sp.]